jgi:hypothetical protein
MIASNVHWTISFRRQLGQVPFEELLLVGLLAQLADDLFLGHGSSPPLVWARTGNRLVVFKV